MALPQSHQVGDIKPKKRFLDSLSCVMAAAMARDITSMDRIPFVNGKPKDI
jgi:hypothetical protein